MVSLLLKDHPHVVLNLAAVESVDSAGLGVMVLLNMWARRCGRTMKFCCISEPVWQLLTLAKLDSCSRFALRNRARSRHVATAQPSSC
jgi:anti-anti-sigma factor